MIPDINLGLYMHTHICASSPPAHITILAYVCLKTCIYAHTTQIGKWKGEGQRNLTIFIFNLQFEVMSFKQSRPLLCLLLRKRNLKYGGFKDIHSSVATKMGNAEKVKIAGPKQELGKIGMTKLNFSGTSSRLICDWKEKRKATVWHCEGTDVRKPQF